MTWISAGIALPQQLLPVIGSCHGEDVVFDEKCQITHICWYDPEYKLWRDWYTGKVIQVEYWMPIPKLDVK